MMGTKERGRAPWAEIARLELRQVVGSAVCWVALVALLALGGLAIVQGAARVAAERATIAALEPELQEQAQHLRSITVAEDDLGLLLYYLAMPVAQEPSAWAAAATGLRGTHPVSRHVRFTGLVPQLYQTELQNPLAEHAGHFDLAFVLCFAIPLVAIGLGYDVRSRDEDLGTAALLRSQPARLSKVVALRLALRAALVGVAALSSLLLSAVAWQTPLDARWFGAALAVLVYTCVWFIAIFLVSSAGRSSAFNAVALTSGWVAMSVLIPALLNLASLTFWPLRGGVELTLEQRLDMNGRWDRPKQETMAPFFERHPEWAGTAVPGDRFSWPWYYAMHEVADARVEARVAEYHDGLERRAQWAGRAAFALPPLALELLFERLAGSDLTTALAFRERIVRYHEELKGAVYPLIFQGHGLAALDLDSLPRLRFSNEAGNPSLRGLLALGLQLLALCALVPTAVRRLDGWGEPEGRSEVATGAPVPEPSDLPRALERGEPSEG